MLDWRWAHLVCAQWIPEVFFRLPEGREPIDVLMVPNQKWNQVTYLIVYTIAAKFELSDKYATQCYSV